MDRDWPKNYTRSATHQQNWCENYLGYGAPSVSNNATAAMLIAIVVIQPNVLLTRPLTLLFMIERLLAISIIITSSGGATIPFNTAV